MEGEKEKKMRDKEAWKKRKRKLRLQMVLSCEKNAVDKSWKGTEETVGSSSATERTSRIEILLFLDLIYFLLLKKKTTRLKNEYILPGFCRKLSRRLRYILASHRWWCASLPNYNARFEHFNGGGQQFLQFELIHLIYLRTFLKFFSR